MSERASDQMSEKCSAKANLLSLYLRTAASLLAGANSSRLGGKPRQNQSDRTDTCAGQLSKLIGHWHSHHLLFTTKNNPPHILPSNHPTASNHTTLRQLVCTHLDFGKPLDRTSFVICVHTIIMKFTETSKL